MSWWEHGGQAGDRGTGAVERKLWGSPAKEAEESERFQKITELAAIWMEGVSGKMNLMLQDGDMG